jgi:hypothetical protein
MVYQYKYIEPDHIKQRLIGRLEFEDYPVPSGSTGSITFGSPVGSKKVDPNLFTRIISQKEVMLENYLNMIYVTPLTLQSENTKLILSEIVENLVVAELLPIYYSAGSVPQTGVEPSSLAGNSDRTARELIQVYITGHNMYVPGVNSQPNYPRGGVPQPVVLPGERLRDGQDQPDTITRYESYTGSYTTQARASNQTFDFDCI